VRRPSGRKTWPLFNPTSSAPASPGALELGFSVGLETGQNAFVVVLVVPAERAFRTLETAGHAGPMRCPATPWACSVPAWTPNGWRCCSAGPWAVGS